ncbi:MAG: neutral/alkaline non-lysosomal ceramidase N-terminal domain-containing protein [Rhabdochlamydiaceae bacterium]
MKIVLRCFFFLFLLSLPGMAIALVKAGVGKAEITPIIGTPSAGYVERKGEGMDGVHDPLLAIALFIDNRDKKIVFCSVDHLGFTYEMVQEITKQIHGYPGLKDCDIFIGSSHTHSGGGAYLNIPVIGPSLAGNYNPDITKAYIDKTCSAILEAYQNQTPAQIGIGYGEAAPLGLYRGLWPKDITPLNFVTVMKVVHPDGRPLAVLFNYPLHPTVLKSQNRFFSADFVGYARNHLQASIGQDVQPIYFNGAQGDIIPVIFNEHNRFDACDRLAKSLANTVTSIWETIRTSDKFQISTQKESYSFKPQPNPFGVTLPLELYKSEMNVIVLNKSHAFITIPGELSCLYDKSLKEIGSKLGFTFVSILGLTNDAHGYIILPDSWQHKTFESALSFGGENYGSMIQKRAESLLNAQAAGREK